jgi:serine/threonine-protein kinase
VRPLSSLPPFEQVLIGLDLPADQETRTFDTTMGRRQESSPAGSDGHGYLPEIAVTLGIGPGAAAQVEPADLQVAELIGRGGMGEVWLARQRSLGREVALKTTPPAAGARAEQALIAEARITGALEHPSIVPVHALGRAASGQPVLVMKRVEGVVWRELLRSPQHPHWASLGSEEPLVVHVQILMQLCNALELAHRRGVVHRDIKPANVMVGSFGEVYLVDWGLAVEVGRLEQGPRRLEGTPAYMAPEMIAGLPVDARTDVYLLGATLHEVLTGAPPHAGRSLAEVLQHGYDAAAHDYPEVPAELAALCRQAMSRDARARPASARVCRDHLAAYLRHRASEAIVRRGREVLAALGEAGAPPSNRRALLEECLVTLRLALAEWPESPAARTALDDWRRIALTVEVDEGNLSTAQHLLEQMDRPPADLGDRVAELERRLTRERQEADRGRRAAFESDAGIGARERRLVGILLAVAVVLVASLAIPHAARGTLGAQEILLFLAVPFVPFALLVILLRRRLLGNVYARRTVALLGLLFTLTLVHRTVAWVAGRPADETLVGDLFVVAGVCGAGGIVLARWWFAGLVAGLTGACLGVWNPALAAPAFSSTALLIAFVAVISWSRDVRAAGRATGAPPGPSRL